MSKQDGEYKGNQTIPDMKRILKDITLKKNREIEEERKKIKDLEDKIRDLERENKELRKANTLLSTDEDVIRKILSLFAQGFTYKSIFDKIQYSGFEGNIVYVKDICTNIEELTSELQLYYKSEIEAHEKKIAINPKLINNTLIQVLQQNINDATQDLDGLQDVKEKSNLRAEIRAHAKELTALTKNIMENDNEDYVDDQVKKIKENLEKRSQRIIKEFDPTQFRVVK